MNKSPRHTIKQGLADRFHVLHQDIEGASLTEFIMGVPAMLIVIIGMMGIYQLNIAGMTVKMEASEKAWVEAIDLQTKTLNKPLSMSSTASGVMSLANTLGNFSGGFGAAITDTIVDPPGGVFIDSFVKVKLADVLFDVGDKPRWKLEDIMRPKDTKADSQPISPTGGGGQKKGRLAAMNIHNDLPFGGIGSTKGIFSTVSSVVGGNLALGAGIRYGHTMDKSDTLAGTVTGGYDYSMGEQYRIDYPTRGSNRIPGVGIAYYVTTREHPTPKASDLNKKGIITFGMLPKIYRPNYGGSIDDRELSDEDLEKAKKCQEAMQKYTDCLESRKSRFLCRGKKPDCMDSNDGKAGGNYLQCIREAVQRNEDPDTKCGDGP